MKGIPIKFRAIEFQTGKTVYGINLTHTHEQEDEETVTWIGDIDNGYHIVDENSITQLVGYDKNGNEVYEGDKIYIGFGRVGNVRIESNFRVSDFELEKGDDND